MDIQQEYHALFGCRGFGVARVDLDGSFLEVNHKFAEMVGYPRAELLTKRWQQITHVEDVAPNEREIQQCVEGKSTHYTMLKRYIDKFSRTVWFRLYVVAIKDGDRCTHLLFTMLQIDVLIAEPHNGRIPFGVDSHGDLHISRPTLLSALQWLQSKWKTILAAIAAAILAWNQWNAQIESSRNDATDAKRAVEELRSELEESKRRARETGD